MGNSMDQWFTIIFIYVENYNKKIEKYVFFKQWLLSSDQVTEKYVDFHRAPASNLNTAITTWI